MKNQSENEKVDKRRETRQLFEKCSPIFIALGDTIRQNIILDIAEAGKEGINVANLTAKTNLSRPAISHHLKVLKDSNLLIPEKSGTQIFYKINILEHINDIKKLVAGIEQIGIENEC